MNRITLESVGMLPNPRHICKVRDGKPPDRIYSYTFDIAGGEKGFGIYFSFDHNSYLNSVSITDYDDDGNWYQPNLAFPNMRTFEELKEVCRLLDITYPENWP